MFQLRVLNQLGVSENTCWVDLRANGWRWLAVSLAGLEQQARSCGAEISLELVTKELQSCDNEFGLLTVDAPRPARELR